MPTRCLRCLRGSGAPASIRQSKPAAVSTRRSCRRSCARPDLFLWDIKDTDDARHRLYTGVSNESIIGSLRRADALGAKTVLRCILLKSVNLDDRHLQAVADLYGTLKHCAGIELIPYHTYGVSKYAQLGLRADAHRDWVPSAEDMRRAEALLEQSAPVIRS